VKKLSEHNRKLSLDYINKCRERNMKQYNPREDQDIKDLDFVPATLKENIYDHVDAKVSFTTQIIETHIGTDIKDRKSIQRHKAKNDEFLWIEIINDYGFKGWLYGKAHYIAFKQQKEWLFVWREDLVKLVESKVQKVFDNKFPLYKLKNRKGSKDIITLIRKTDINPIIIPRKL
tara:strand:+ start:18 stop:542 length:525 start_codon:yes stop_codon:yes gene_type:complete